MYTCTFIFWENTSADMNNKSVKRKDLNNTIAILLFNVNMPYGS